MIDINQFMMAASLKLPHIITPKLELSREEEEGEYIHFVFSLPRPLAYSEFCREVNRSHGMVELYRHLPALSTDYGWTLCAFQQIGTGPMMELQGATDGAGKVTQVEVKLYASAERMYADLTDELQRVGRMSGEFVYALTQPELMSYFLM